MDDIGQGAGEPPVSGWTPPEFIRSYTGLDVTADGKSMLLAVTPYFGGLPFTPILGLVRLDIGGTPDQPTLTLHLVASRANALGTLHKSSDWSAQSNEWYRKPPVYEYGECGVRRVTQEGTLYPSPTNRQVSVPKGYTLVQVTSALAKAFLAGFWGLGLSRMAAFTSCVTPAHPHSATPLQPKICQRVSKCRPIPTMIPAG